MPAEERPFRRKQLYQMPRLRLPEPPAVTFQPHTGLQYPCLISGSRWEIKAQTQITIHPQEHKTLQLGMGVIIRKGAVYAAIKQSLREKRLVLHDSIISETANTVIVSIFNNSSEVITIQAGEPFIYLGRP